MTEQSDGDKQAHSKTTECRVCHQPYGTHEGYPKLRVCESCGRPVSHCVGEESRLCWEGRAGLAAAKRGAGFVLNRVEQDALSRAGLV